MKVFAFRELCKVWNKWSDGTRSESRDRENWEIKLKKILVVSQFHQLLTIYISINNSVPSEHLQMHNSFDHIMILFWYNWAFDVVWTGSSQLGLVWIILLWTTHFSSPVMIRFKKGSYSLRLRCISHTD